MMHQDIKRFGMEGVLDDDASIIRLREQFEHLLLQEMRDAGYVPVLDLGPYWTTELVDGKYNFVLSIHGVKVGRDRSWKIEGISEAREMSRPTPRIKSVRSSTPAE